MGTRVWPFHTKALLEALPAAKIALGVTHSMQAFAAILAEAVVSADDDRTRYAILARLPSGSFAIFGPYPSHKTATNAAEKGLPLATVGMYVLPLYPFPKRKG